MSRSEPNDTDKEAPPAGEGAKLKRRILIADDNELTGRQLQQLLQADPQLAVDTVTNGNEALTALTKQNYSILITDLRMPQLDGIQLIEQIQKHRLPVTVIVTTGHGSIDEAVQAMRLGAYDFITKPVELEHLRLVVQRALRERALQDELLLLREQVQNKQSYQNIISKSPRMHAIFELIGNLAHTSTTVLVEGETGTGKEMIARAIHQASDRRDAPMIAVNCAALPETLLESELFGHEKGAFTSAVKLHRGRFEQADGGTIFLDEVGDIPAAMQAKLLRVLQERQFERVGGAQSIEVDVRVIGATNRSLPELVQEKKFREDLYYRLNVVKLSLPPLRERKEDIPLLAAHFAAKYALAGQAPKNFDPAAMEALLRHGWPGNIRELENAIEHACIVSRDAVVRAENLPAELLSPTDRPVPGPIDWEQPLPELMRELNAGIEKEYLRRAIERADGDLHTLAEITGVSAKTLSHKLAEYDLAKDVTSGE